MSPKEEPLLAHDGGRNWTSHAFFPWLNFQVRKKDVIDDEDVGDDKDNDDDDLVIMTMMTNDT